VGRTDRRDVRFAFGRNWQSFLDRLDEGRVSEAERSLQALLQRDRLDGATFLDIGSGSGLFSLAARRLGAKVHSFDADAESVACTMMLRERHGGGDADWIVQQGSVLDGEFLGRLGRFDIVHAWGVLHHTGALGDALRNAADLTAPGGTFAFALYAKTAFCPLWAREKRWYAGATPAAQRRARAVYVALMRLYHRLRGRDFDAYVAGYMGKRGMDFAHDVHDWLGGYPYESIAGSEVATLMTRLGFDEVRSVILPPSLGAFGSGCNEYVYRRRAG